jgi:hypothetical protein
MESTPNQYASSAGGQAPPNLSGASPVDFAAIKDNFYNSLEEADTLIDYFCVVGVDQIRVQQLAGARKTLPQEVFVGEL